MAVWLRQYGDTDFRLVSECAKQRGSERVRTRAKNGLLALRVVTSLGISFCPEQCGFGFYESAHPHVAVGEHTVVSREDSWVTRTKLTE